MRARIWPPTALGLLLFTFILLLDQITSLMKVASALGRSVGYFIEEADPLRPVTVVRRDERALLFNCANGNKYPLVDRSKRLVLLSSSNRLANLRNCRLNLPTETTAVPKSAIDSVRSFASTSSMLLW